MNQSDDFKYFVDNRLELYTEYPNKFLIIQDKEIKGIADSFEDALNKAIKEGLILGSFIIQECGEDENCYTQRFSSNVVFA